MKTLARSVLISALGTAALSAALFGAEARIGQPAPDFSLPDLSGKTQKLSDYRGKIVVLEWVNPGCPIVRKHYESHNMQATQKAAVADGVIWLSINSASYPGAQGNLAVADAARWEKEMGATATAYLRDETGKVGHLYGARTTPHMFVIDKEGVLRYNGAIDSIPSADPDDIPRATNYVNAALSAIKAGKPVAKPSTQPYGCHIQYGS
jgi:hypothetical protein